MIKQLTTMLVACVVGVLALTSEVQAQAPNPPQQPSPTFHAANQSSGGVTAVGDSVMLGAKPALQADISDIYVDAVVSRQASAAIQTLSGLHAAGDLGSVVVVQIGNNGTFTSAQFDQMMQVLAGVPRVVVVNVKVPRPWEYGNNRVIASGVYRYSNTVLVDWYDESVDSPALFWSDAIHLRPTGARVYAQMIASAVYGG